MYKVLLADDELLDLEGMKQFIPWSELGLEVVGAVSNGFAACTVMEKLPIDILVTDVNMPNMSGLELARIAIERNPDIRIIFVSGYQDFDFVKQALSLKACNYVLKPMDDQELIVSLEEVTQQLNEEYKRKEAEENYRQIHPMAKNDFLLRVFEGEFLLDQSGGLMGMAISYGLTTLQGQLQVAVLEMDNLEWDPYELEPANLPLLQSFFKEIDDIMLFRGLSHSCKLSRQRLAIVLEGDQVQSVLNEMYQMVNGRLSMSMTVGLGSAVADMTRLHISYKQALQALDGKMFIGKGLIINYEDVRRTNEISDARKLDIRLDALFQAMSNYELVQIHDEIENLFQSISMLRSKFTVYNLTMYIVWKLDHYLKLQGEDLFQMLKMDLDSLDVVMEFEMMDEIRSWLVRKVYVISEMLRQKENSKNSKLVREIMNTVRERMNDNITLKDIAQKFSFSPNYLGHLFKEEVGKSFSEVLIGVRMEHARELLKDPSLKIYEIADQVGYRYIPYFSKQFKETYGMTPMEFRKRE